MNNDLKCILIDSSMDVYKINQDTIQKLFTDKILDRKDITEEIGNEDIVDLLWEIIYHFRQDNIYDLGLIIDRLNDIKTDMEIEYTKDLPF